MFYNSCLKEMGTADAFIDAATKLDEKVSVEVKN
jgi:hypothetical protein